MQKPQQRVRKSSILLFLFCLTVSSVVIVLDAKELLQKPKNAVRENIVTPIKKATKLPSIIGNAFSNLFQNQDDLSAQIDAKDKEIVWLKATLSNLTVLEAENRRLKLLLESSTKQTIPVSIAEVIDSHIDASKHNIEISEGSENKVFIGQIAIDENGVLGQITKVNSQTSILSLITDKRQRVPVFVERNRVRGIAQGTGYLNELELNFVSIKADIIKGDVLVTSGLGGRYPRGYKVGIVTEVDYSPKNLFTVVKAKPVALIDKVLEVLLIDTKKRKPYRII